MTDVGSLVLLNVIFWMYASLTQELFMHPLLVLFNFRKKTDKKTGSYIYEQSLQEYILSWRGN